MRRTGCRLPADLQWTVDMFMIFSLRRANILPYTDLGVQKGLLRFALTAHHAFPQNPKEKGKEKAKFVLGAKKAAKGKAKSEEEAVVIDKVDTAGGGELDSMTTSMGMGTGRTTPPPHTTPAAATTNSGQRLPPTPLTPTSSAPPFAAARTVLHTPNEPGSFSSNANTNSKMVMPPTPDTPGYSTVNGYGLSSQQQAVKPIETLQVEEKVLPPSAPDDVLEPMPDDPTWDADRIAPLKNGLTLEIMKSRWAGKKAKWVWFGLPLSVATGLDGLVKYKGPAEEGHS
jgi:DNA-3-methyladenine glycosylase II